MNRLFDDGQFERAREQFDVLSQIATGEDRDDLLRASAACEMAIGDLDEAIARISQLQNPDSDDRRLLIALHREQGDVEAYEDALLSLPRDEFLKNPDAIAILIRRSLHAGDHDYAWEWWHWFRSEYPEWEGLPTLREEVYAGVRLFGYGPRSMWNYARGVADGTVGVVVDTARGVWHVIRHPIQSGQAVYEFARATFTADNLALLFSPRELSVRLGEFAIDAFDAAWRASLDVTAERMGADLRDLAKARAVHERAAGRIGGYVLPELALLAIPPLKGATTAGRGARAADKAGDVVKGLDDFTATLRWGDRADDLRRFPALKRVRWMDANLFDALRRHPRIQRRFSKVLDDVASVSDIPGAESLVRQIARHADSPNLEGWLFQLDRAAHHARRGDLVAIGKSFSVSVSLPGKPVRVMRGDADLVLTNKTLVEAKFRSGTLTLDETFATQLAKYRRAVLEGQFDRIVIETNAPVSRQVRDRIAQIVSDGVPIEVLNLGY